MSIEDAPGALDFIEAQQILADHFVVDELSALDTCIRAIVRDEFAKLSTAAAPTPDDMPKPEEGGETLVEQLQRLAVEYFEPETNDGADYRPDPRGEMLLDAANTISDLEQRLASSSGAYKMMLAQAEADLTAARSTIEERDRRIGELEKEVERWKDRVWCQSGRPALSASEHTQDGG